VIDRTRRSAPVASPAFTIAAPEPRFRTARLPALACCLVLPGAALAAESVSTSAGAVEEVQVWASRMPDLAAPTTAGSRLNLSMLETPASVEVLDADAIRQRGDASILEAVTRVTGVAGSGNPGNGGTSLVSRGFSGHGSVMQLYDGMRLYVAAGTVTFPFDPWMAERIEVLRGPASVLYGEGAIGGAVNVVPRQPNMQELQVDSQTAFGSDQTVRTALGMGGPVNESVSYRVDVSRNASDNWVDRGDSESLAIAGTLRAAVTPDLVFTLSHDYGQQEPMRYLGAPLINGALDDRTADKNYNVADSNIHYVDNWTRLKTEWSPSEAVSMRNDLYRLTTDRTWRNAEGYQYDAASGLIDRFDYLGIRHDEEQIGDRADVTIRHAIRGMANAVVLGVEANEVELEYSHNFDLDLEEIGADTAVDPYSFDPGAFYYDVPIEPRFSTKTTQYAVFAEDRLAFNERWSVVGGVRADRIEVARDVIGSERLYDESFDSLGWRVGVVAEMSPGLSLYGQYSEGADPLGSLITASLRDTNFDLPTAAQVELGLKQAFADDRGYWTFAAYDIVKKNLLTAHETIPGLTLPVAERSARGVEASLMLQVAPTVLIEANAAVLTAEYDKFNEGFSSNVPPGVPEQMANLWVTWQFMPAWRVQGGARYVGKTYANNANTFDVPEYTVVDAALEWAVARNVSAALRGYNLTDETYVTNAYGDQQWILGRPRAAELAVNVGF
jgi:iron complex outermembrane receptor protein